MQADQLFGGLRRRSCQPFGQGCHCLRRRCAIAPLPGQSARQLALPARLLHLFVIACRTRQICPKNTHRLIKTGAVKFFPARPQNRHRCLFFRWQQRSHRIQQRAFLHPAARECIQRQNRANQAVSANRAPPRDVVRIILSRGTKLIEQHDHRLANPGQHFHFQRHVSCRLRIFGSVHEVENDIGFVARVLYRLLTGPQSALTEPVPHL